MVFGSFTRVLFDRWSSFQSTSAEMPTIADVWEEAHASEPVRNAFRKQLSSELGAVKSSLELSQKEAREAKAALGAVLKRVEKLEGGARVKQSNPEAKLDAGQSGTTVAKLKQDVYHSTKRLETAELAFKTAKALGDKEDTDKKEEIFAKASRELETAKKALIAAGKASN